MANVQGKIEYLTLLDGVKHGFFTRSGGVSEGEYASLNVGTRRGDDPKNTVENCRRICEALGVPFDRLTLTKQEHGDNIEIIGEEAVGRGMKTAWDRGVDAIMTELPDTPLMCYTADCVPVLLYSEKAVAAIHAGWRGSAAHITQKTVEKMARVYGVLPSGIRAAIGPCIGMCCYEVSPDVAENFGESVRREKDNGKFMLDLEEENRLQLESAGVLPENIACAHICTFCNNDRFFSHRVQNGKSGVFASVIVK